jgi:ATP-dependent RNA helicase DeaD
MVSVEFNRFINYYKKTRDISNQSSGSERRDDRDGAQEKIIMVVQQDIL